MYPVVEKSLSRNLCIKDGRKSVVFPFFEEQKGKRNSMEDTVLVYKKDGFDILAVFDGHGGRNVAAYLKDLFPLRFEETLEKINSGLLKELTYKQMWNEERECLFENPMHTVTLKPSLNENMEHILRYLFYKMQIDLRESNIKDKSGSTAALAVVFDGVVTCAYVGDTECYIVTKTGFVNMTPFLHNPVEGTPDHKRALIVEEDSDTYKTEDGRWCCGCLAVSRSFERVAYLDHGEEPTITQWKLDEDCIGIYIGCDGMRDSNKAITPHTPETIVSLILDCLSEGKEPREIPKILVDNALDIKKSNDNVSVIYASLI